jgi:Asp-tRNA(Asn)/Glu-tRNA(Gln) amidotransferase A subunit family amidase
LILAFVKTNIPQSLMSFECSNPVFGSSMNPWNSAYTPGGSTGGEAALICKRGSVLGVGSDIAGSLRIPAHFCGIFSLKPSARRIPDNQTDYSHGFESVLVSVGPMGISVDDLKLFIKVVIDSCPWKLNPNLLPIPFREFKFSSGKRLKVGYYISDGFLDPTPPCKRSVMEVVAALEKKGHEVVKFDPPNTLEAVALCYKLFGQSNFAQIRHHLKGDVLDPCLWSPLFIYSMPSFLKNVFATVLTLFGYNDAAKVFILLNIAASKLS